MLTREQVEQSLPATLKSSATQQFTDQINNITSDPIVAEEVRNNFLSFSHILKEGKFKTEDYLHAVTYVSYKLMGLSNQESYIKTFPQRYQTLIANGKTPKDISSYVSMYHKNKLVNIILEQVLVPVWVLNQDLFQKAINVQADLMLNAKSEKVRSDAANSLLIHLAKPKESSLAVKIDVQENEGMNELKNLLQNLAQKQLEAVDNGITVKEIAATKIIEGEYEEVS